MEAIEIPLVQLLSCPVSAVCGIGMGLYLTVAVCGLCMGVEWWL